MTSARPFNILITDDDPEARETFRDIFEPVGFRTLLAESGEEAIDIVKDQEVHLALLDMYLPRLTGLEVMGIVKQIKGLLPMILMSADRDDHLMQRALSAQAYCVLGKPISKNVVIYVVNRALVKFYDSELSGSA